MPINSRSLSPPQIPKTTSILTIIPTTTPPTTTSTNIQEIPGKKPSKRIERTTSFRIITPNSSSLLNLPSADEDMTRARSGSFYCPIEPVWALSLSQKAEISTATPSSSTPPMRRHVRTPSGDYQHVHSPQSPRAAVTDPKSSQAPRFLSTPELSSKYGFGANATPSVSASTFARKRHAHSPARPSPLSGEVAGPRPRCPSAIWTSSTSQTRHHHHQRSRSSPASSSTSSLHKSVLKGAFMAGPMARKARMYGLRVAWCVFGDARVEMARDIFGRGSTSAGILGAPAEVEPEVQHEESVEMPMHDMTFEWELDTQRSLSRSSSSTSSGSQHRGYSSYLEIDQLESDSDEDSVSSDESDYGSDETESGESDELDDEEEIHRSALAVFEQTALDSPLGKKHAHVADDARWETLAFE